MPKNLDNNGKDNSLDISLAKNEHPPVSEDILAKWQKITNLMAGTIGVVAGLVMRVHPTVIEVFVSSNTVGNPYRVGTKESLKGELYCETVMSQRAMLLIPNALKDPLWENNPDIKLNMISYLGFPLIWPNNDIFGTLCVLDNKEKHYNAENIQLMQQFSEIINDDLKFLTETQIRQQAEFQLMEQRDQLQIMVEARTSELSKELHERIQAEEKLRNAQEKLITQEKLAALGQMAGGVAHDLRQPLGVLTNAIYYLRSTLSHSDETTQEYLNMVNVSVKTIDEIIVALLDFARTKQAQKEQVNISDLLHNILEQNTVPQNIIMQIDIPSSLPPVLVDTRQIQQVLVNLVENAYQAMPDGGELTFDCRKNDNHIQLNLTDTGVGIEPDKIDQIFEPLFTTKSDGIGLGLAIAKQLVEINDGYITVESPVLSGTGTTFSLALPIFDGSYD